MKKKFALIFLLMILIFQTKVIFSQELNIVLYLKKIEDGNSQSVIADLPKLKKEYPQSSSVIFLDAVLTGDGKKAVDKYLTFIKDYPKSKYADASLYRIYSYYYAEGMYITSKNYLTQLQINYPSSPYIDIANKNIPLTDKEIIGNKQNGKSEISSNKETKSFSRKTNLSIQVGAFTVLANADNLKNKLVSSGYNARIEEKEIAGAVFHVVYVDGFATQEEAERTLQIINSKFNLSGRVIEQQGNDN